jgi:gluconate 2-dehydrogenase gamma chain
MAEVSRRTLIKGTGALGVSMLPAALAPDAATAQEHREHSASSTHYPADPTTDPGTSAQSQTYLFLNDEEAAFIEVAVARLIPKDEQWAGALETGVPNYIDKQLAGAWGAGERLYRNGPWQPGTPSQGYQLPFTPAELFRTALGAINKELAQTDRPLAKMNPDECDSYLRSLEAGEKNLAGVPSDVFFAHLWQCTLEGFFSDPVYGGNRDMASWRMIGFPGAYASYYDLVDQHGIRIDRQPTSLGEDVHGHVHMNPGIPARSP